LTSIGRRIAHEINTSHYDVVFAHPCYYTSIPAFLRFVQIPAVYYLHEPFGPTFLREFQRPYLKRPSRWREVSRRLDPLFNLYNCRLEGIRTKSIRKATRLLANSRFTQRHMRLAYQVDTPICHYGVDSERFCPMPDVRKDNMIISVGELTPRKGFDFLIKSLAHLSSGKRPTLELVCNWVSPPERNYVEALAEQCNVGLRILTCLDTDQLALEYNRAQLCVYAPVSEPLGLVPLESMACGTPVVGVREAGVCETILHGETGLLVERDPIKFAAAVSTLLEDRKLWVRYGRQGRSYVEREWSWESSTRELEAHLTSV
jgi:glycosyltransferase involved in cell wall biosynthesis